MILYECISYEGAYVELGLAYAKGKKCYGIKTNTRAVEMKLDLNLMIVGCFVKIFKKCDGARAIKELKQYLSEKGL